MSSTNKTEYLNLNAWIGADLPKMEDFNSDNEILDDAFQTHDTDTVRHITDGERSKWNAPVFTGSYIGDDTESRTITLACAFEPSMLILYANNAPAFVCDFNNRIKETYFAIGTKRGSTAGLTMQSGTCTGRNDTTTVLANELRRLNKAGTSYTYIAFR